MEKSKNLKWLMLAMFLWVISFSIITPSAYASSKISDINGHWGQFTIQKLVDAGVVAGNPDGTFTPDKNISRAEFSVMVVRAFNLQQQTGKVFSDTANHWAKDYIATANANGIVTGYGNDKFGPDDPITREQMAIMIIKAAKYQAATSELTFADSSQVSSWAKEAVATAYANKIISGYNNYFRPLDKATKAEAAVIINAGMAAVSPQLANELDKAGTYGPATGTQTIEGDLVISVSGVVLQNTIITGDLILAKEIGNGDVTLNNITVKGKTYIRGGGINSIHINGGQYSSIVIEKTPSGSIRIVATDASGLPVIVAENAAGEQIILEGNFDSVDIQASNVNISTQGTTSIGEITVGSNLTGTTINLASGTTVNTVQFNSTADVNGQGTITTAAGSKANASTFETKPGTTPRVSSGGGGGSSTVYVSAITITGAGDTNTVGNGRTLQMSAAITPTNATNQTIAWSVAPGTGTATINAAGLLTATLAGTVTVTATNTASGVVGTKVITVETATPAMDVSFYTGTGFSKSIAPIVESNGNVTQTIGADGSIEITVSNDDGYIDSGFVMQVGTLGELGSINVQGTGDYGLNLYFDVNKDGEFFDWTDGIFNGVGGDAYALYQGPFGNEITIDNASSFNLMGTGGGVNTVSELKAKYDANTPVGIWVGVTSSDGTEKTATISLVTLN